MSLKNGNTCFLILCILLMCGCGAVRITPAIAEAVQAEAAKRKDAEQARDSAIHSSQDARAAAMREREAARSLRALADEKDSEVKRLESEAVQLHHQEVADRITMYSWWLIGAGLVATAVALFMALRFGGRTAWTGVIAGGGTAALGLVGLLIAPWWLTIAWVAGVLVLLGAIVLVIRTLLLHRSAVETVTEQWKTYANALGRHAPDAREYLDNISVKTQPPAVVDLITKLLAK